MAAVPQIYTSKINLTKKYRRRKDKALFYSTNIKEDKTRVPNQPYTQKHISRD